MKVRGGDVLVGRLRAVAPVMPAKVDPARADILARIQRRPEAANVVLGGFFALSHYLSGEYRETNDVDAWWIQGLDQRQQDATLSMLRTVMQEVGRENGTYLNERQHGEVIYLDLKQGNSVTSSFQIAPRTIELAAPFVEAGLWSPMAVESLADNLASKMAALVKRGAPRDFTDIYTVVHQGMVTFEELLVLWQIKVPDGKVEEAGAEVAHKLAIIELRRPLAGLDGEAREKAEALRAWYHSVLQN